LTLRIINLEDSPLDADLIRARLQDAGVECDVVRVDRRETFEAAMLSSADLILADYSLPGYSGTEALETARRLQPRTPFIFVTGALGEERAIDLLKAGATDYVLKERLGRLIPAVSRALREAEDHAERLRAEEDLRRSEERLRMAQQAAGAALWDIDLESETAWSGDTEVLGDTLASPPSYQELLALIHEADAPRAQHTIQQALECRGSIDVQFRINHPTRGERWLHVVARPVCDETGRATRITGIALDITQHKRAELQLEQRARELEDLYRLSEAVARAARAEDVYDIALDALTSTPGAGRASILLFDPDGVMRFKAWRGLSDAYRAAVEGHSPWTMDDPAPTPITVSDVRNDPSLAPFLETIQRENIRAMAFIPLLYEGRVLGKFMLYREMPHEWPEQEVRRAQSVANNVAFSLRSKLAQQALKESEERFRALAEAVPDIVFVAAADGRLEYLNRRFYEYTGVSPQDALAGVGLPAVHEEDTESVRHSWEASMASGAAFEMTFRLRSASGRYRWFMGRATAIHGQNGAIDRWFGTSTDIDALIQTEQDLAYHAAQLARSNTDLEDFAYVASHDLKEPLRGISNYSTFLLEDYGDQLPADGREKLETLVRLSKRMYELLDHLLEYSRAGRTDLAIQDVALEDVVTRALDGVRARLDQDKVDVVVHTPLPRIRCDPLRIGQVLGNLIVNAVKYNDTAEKRVEIGVANTEEGLAIFVKDNGIGIPPQHKESVFRMFKRLHARDRYGGGTGAGLAIVKKIIQRHNGLIWLESTPGMGTTFYFTIGAPREGHAPNGPRNDGRTGGLDLAARPMVSTPDQQPSPSPG
jgi:PAS domain S-box-containing protein